MAAPKRKKSKMLKKLVLITKLNSIKQKKIKINLNNTLSI